VAQPLSACALQKNNILVESIILSAVNSGSYKKNKNGNHQYLQLTTLVNSASTAPLICLPLKGAQFCHTSKKLLMGYQHRRALLRLYFNSLRLVVGHWLVSLHSKGCRALGGFPPKG
jgi:hypothetical protein